MRCAEVQISPANRIYRMCVASNTTMNHLFAGINADYLRTEPYIPAFFKTNSLFASDVGIEINKDAHIIMARISEVMSVEVLQRVLW